MNDSMVGKKVYKKRGYFAGITGIIESDDTFSDIPYVIRYYVNDECVATLGLTDFDDVVICND